MLCSIAQLPLSTYHAAKHRLSSRRYEHERELIRSIFAQSRGRYGYRRVSSVLNRSYAIHLSGKTVLKLMREEGCICTIRARARKYSSYKGSVGHSAPNTLNRDFSASVPNQKWVTDITEFSVGMHRIYLSPIIDLYNKEVISYAVSLSPTMEMIRAMLADAQSRITSNDNLIMHSDQGWHYQHILYTQTLKKLGITQSMSRKGNCLDNACAEGFFSQVKSELLSQKRYQNPEDLIADIKAYITWYNRERIQLKLKGLSPVEYRTQFENTA